MTGRDSRPSTRRRSDETACADARPHLPDPDLRRAGQRPRDVRQKPIGKYQAIQWILADSAVEIHAARLRAYHLAWLVDQGDQPIKESSIVKLHNTEMVNRVADRAVQIFGGMGLLAEGPVERIFRYVRMLRIVEGTSTIQRLVIARSLGL